MSEHNHHSHPGKPEQEPFAPPVDTGSRALEEALRSSFGIIKVLMVLLIAVFAFSGVKIVKPQERAVILRFGKPLGTGADQLLGPGLHWAFPYPIDEVVSIPITEIQKATSTIGWYSMATADEVAGRTPPALPSLNPAAEGYLVTSDNNIIHVRATLGYRITDPLAYTFNFTNAPQVVVNVLNNALVYAAAQSTVDQAMLDNTLFKERVLARVRDRIEALKLGITLEEGSEVKVVPPAFVKPDFDAVTIAQQDRSTAENKARGEAESVVRGAEAEANAIISAAEADRVRTVQLVESDAKRFAALLPEYRQNPELYRQRLLTEAWQRVLAKSQDKFISVEPVEPGKTELRLLLNREPLPARTNPSAQP